MADMIAGQVQLTFANGPTVAPHIKSKRLKALAVTTAQHSPLFPDLPTVAASLPGYESGTSTGVFAPAKTPAAIINRLNQEVVRFLNTTEARDRFFAVGSETVGNSPEELAAGVKSEMVKLGKVIKDVGIRED
jgi:tripartite-type tricarboxylate transporter receptor subunit TctC